MKILDIRIEGKFGAGRNPKLIVITDMVYPKEREQFNRLASLYDVAERLTKLRDERGAVTYERYPHVSFFHPSDVPLPPYYLALRFALDDEKEHFADKMKRIHKLLNALSQAATEVDSFLTREVDTLMHRGFNARRDGAGIEIQSSKFAEVRVHISLYSAKPTKNTSYGYSAVLGIVPSVRLYDDMIARLMAEAETRHEKMAKMRENYKAENLSYQQIRKKEAYQRYKVTKAKNKVFEGFVKDVGEYRKATSLSAMSSKSSGVTEDNIPKGGEKQCH